MFAFNVTPESDDVCPFTSSATVINSSTCSVPACWLRADIETEIEYIVHRRVTHTGNQHAHTVCSSNTYMTSASASSPPRLGAVNVLDGMTDLLREHCVDHAVTSTRTNVFKIFTIHFWFSQH